LAAAGLAVPAAVFAVAAGGVAAAPAAGAEVAAGAAVAATGAFAAAAGAGAAAATGATGTHGVVTAVVAAGAGCFFFPKIEVMLLRAEAALDALVVAMFAAFCAAAEFVAPAIELSVLAGPHAGGVPPAPANIPLTPDATAPFELGMTAPGAVPFAPFVRP
jgi:hypothetical protein